MRAEVCREDDSTSWYEVAPDPDAGADRLAFVWWDDGVAEWSWCVLDTAEDYTAEGSSSTREGAERDVTAILRGRGYTVEGA